MERHPERPERVRYGVTAGGKTLPSRPNGGTSAASLAEQYLWLGGRGPRKKTVGCQAGRQPWEPGERRNEVIAAKCTVTALPCSQSVPRIYSHVPTLRFRR